PATVRAVCYRLFTQNLIANMSKGETDKVSRALTLARERGWIAWEWIVDETRHVEQRPGWDDPAAFMAVAKRSYRLDRWQDQPERILVVSEKATIGGLLRPVLHAYGVGFLVLHGFGSATALNDLADFSLADDRPLSLLYIGDHDPSGRYMSDVDISQRLDKYGGQATLSRLAVTPEQIAAYDLPTFAAETKAKDARYRWFLDHHGVTCCELDALNPNVLRLVVEDAIVGVIDWPTWDRAEVAEAAQLRSLDNFFTSWPGAA
ncbi:MAG: hypothetical protein M3464_01180, partial [Chloroflexota bacterium]|nr:hypothetical protein [Chloroflexota bacterium]